MKRYRIKDGVISLSYLVTAVSALYLVYLNFSAVVDGSAASYYYLMRDLYVSGDTSILIVGFLFPIFIFVVGLVLAINSYVDFGYLEGVSISLVGLCCVLLMLISSSKVFFVFLISFILIRLGRKKQAASN